MSIVVWTIENKRKYVDTTIGYMLNGDIFCVLFIGMMFCFLFVSRVVIFSIMNSTSIACSFFFLFFSLCFCLLSLPVHLHFHHLKKWPNIIVYEKEIEKEEKNIMLIYIRRRIFNRSDECFSFWNRKFIQWFLNEVKIKKQINNMHQW